MSGSAHPTPYDDLNEVLAALVAGDRDVLGDNFVGAYLQGSFALGGFDERSDCDFVIVVERDVAEGPELDSLQALHEELHRLPSAWARHLEGSYAPRETLRRSSAAPRDPPGSPRSSDWRDPFSGQPPRSYPFLFLNNGAHRLVRSEHDDSDVVRWILREHGIVLSGPPPRDFIDPVPPEALRTTARRTLRLVRDWIETDPEALEAEWAQAFTVLIVCRILQTLETGRMHSKPESVEWAKRSLAPRWTPLVERAFRQRERLPRGRSSLEPRPPMARADAEEARRTRDLLTLALNRVGRRRSG